jgi:hypothetical protein
MTPVLTRLPQATPTSRRLPFLLSSLNAPSPLSNPSHLLLQYRCTNPSPNPPPHRISTCLLHPDYIEPPLPRRLLPPLHPQDVHKRLLRRLQYHTRKIKRREALSSPSAVRRESLGRKSKSGNSARLRRIGRRKKKKRSQMDSFLPSSQVARNLPPQTLRYHPSHRAMNALLHVDIWELLDLWDLARLHHPVSQS